MNTRVEISVRTVVLLLLILLGGWLLFQIRDILFLLFIAFLLMTAILPIVIFLERFRIPRAAGILIVYAIVFGFFGVSLVGAVPLLINQTTRLIQSLPEFVAQVLPNWNVNLSSITQQAAPIGQSIINITVSIFSNVVTLVTVLVFTFYFIMERRNADSILKGFIGIKAAERTLVVLKGIEKRLGGWVSGQLILMGAVGLVTYLGLVILRVDYALPLALLAGMLELIPMVGPIVSAIPGILVATSISPLLALSVAALYIIIQQLENNILVPIVMKKSVGFAPIVTILILMIGARLAGVVGAVLGIPVALVIQELLSVFIFNNKKS